jgi:hypothetical protein
MLSSRASEILRTLEQRQSPTATPEEVGELQQSGAVTPVDPADYQALQGSATRLEDATRRVRELRRQLDQQRGPKVSLPRGTESPGNGLRAELQQATAELEELGRSRAALDASVHNPATGGYLRPTLAGRRMASELAAWGGRMGQLPFGEFLEQIAEVRQRLTSVVGAARSIYDAFQAQAEAGTGAAMAYSGPPVRAAAVVLAKTPDAGAATTSVFRQEYLGEAAAVADPADRYLVTTLTTASGHALTGELLGVHAALTNRGLAEAFASDTATWLVASALVDLPASTLPVVVERIVWLTQALRGLGGFGAAAMARSPYPVEELPARYSAALEVLSAHGFAGGEPIPSAAALLAASPHATPILGERFAALLTQLADVFEPPMLPTALLTALPLEPSEAVHLFHLAVATITRGGFFDATVEIDYLAILLMYGEGPRVLASPGAGVALSGVAPPGPLLTPEVGRVWMLYNNYWAMRQLAAYTLTHPIHIHSVPVFG